MAWSERGGEAARLGHALLAEEARLFALFKRGPAKVMFPFLPQVFARGKRYSLR